LSKQSELRNSVGAACNVSTVAGHKQAAKSAITIFDRAHFVFYILLATSYRAIRHGEFGLEPVGRHP
jgi:hypothetical protein